MPEVLLFAEDAGFAAVLNALIQRIAREAGGEVVPKSLVARRGYERVKRELREFIREVNRGYQPAPALLVVGVDANCKGAQSRRQDLLEIVGDWEPFAVFAVAEPHVERWLLLDGQAFHRVVGAGCDLPDQKCDTDRYKGLLRQAVRDAGVEPIAGGLEHAERLMEEIDLDRAARLDRDFGQLVRELRQRLRS